MHTAMILAAGRGARLRPLTDLIPKPMIKVQGIPLIERHVVQLAQAGFKQIIINHAHLGGIIKQHFGNGARWHIDILYSPEPPGALETGGGIVNALPWLGDLPFVTVSADIMTDYDFKQLQLPVSSLAHVVLVTASGFSPDFGLSKEQYLENDNRAFTFANIACFNPLVFQHKEPGRYPVAPLLRALCNSGHATGEIYHGAWSNINSIQDLLRLNAQEAIAKI